MGGEVVVGRVHKVFEEQRLIFAEAWIQFGGYYNETPRYIRSLTQTNYTMNMETVLGPLVSQHRMDETTSRKGAEVVQISLESVKQHMKIEPDDRSGTLDHLATSTHQMYYLKP